MGRFSYVFDERSAERRHGEHERRVAPVRGDFLCMQTARVRLSAAAEARIV